MDTIAGLIARLYPPATRALARLCHPLTPVLPSQMSKVSPRDAEGLGKRELDVAGRTEELML